MFNRQTTVIGVTAVERRPTTTLLFTTHISGVNGLYIGTQYVTINAT